MEVVSVNPWENNRGSKVPAVGQQQGDVFVAFHPTLVPVSAPGFRGFHRRIKVTLGRILGPGKRGREERERGSLRNLMKKSFCKFLFI
jgi:hypothetical protein